MVGKRAEFSTLVSKKSFKIRDLDETIKKDEVVYILCRALGRPVLDGSCRLFTRFGGVKTADATCLLQPDKIRIGWDSCCIHEHAGVARCFRYRGCSHGSRSCSDCSRKHASWRCGTTGHWSRSCKAPLSCLTCLDRGKRDIAHVSGEGSCPVFGKSFEG